MENNKFEDGWKNAFEGAESTPHDSVWSGVESDLLAAENKRMRRTVVFYQRLAAAMAVFGLITSALSFYYWKDSTNLQVERKTAVHGSPKTGRDVLDEIKKKQSSANGQRQITSTHPTAYGTRASVAGVNSATGSSSRLFVNTDGTSDRAVAGIKVNANPEPERVTQLSFSGKLPGDSSETILAIEPLASASKVQSQKKEKIEIENAVSPVDVPEKIIEEGFAREMLWVSAGASTGSYNPGLKSAYASPAPAGTNIPYVYRSASQQESVGTATSLWLTVSSRISKRWAIRGGVNYLNQRLGYTSNLVSTAASTPQAFVSIYSNTVASAVTTSMPYPINSVLEYVSIPVQACYLIVDHKIGLQMNGGLAADFFLRNSLQDQSGHAASFSQGAGSESPYRSLNWAGLVSTELSYRVARQYRLSIVPGMRYAFNSALKSGSGHPYVMDIGFRLRYLLK